MPEAGSSSEQLQRYNSCIPVMQGVRRQLDRYLEHEEREQIRGTHRFTFHGLPQEDELLHGTRRYPTILASDVLQDFGQLALRMDCLVVWSGAEPPPGVVTPQAMISCSLRALGNTRSIMSSCRTILAPWVLPDQCSVLYGAVLDGCQRTSNQSAGRLEIC